MPPVAIAYLGSHFLSLLGNGILAVALPLIVLQTGLSPLSVGAVSMATAAPALLVGLLAGVLLDHFNRRTSSMIADVVSASAVAAIPLVDLLWGLNLWSLIALAIVGSFGDIPGMTARQVLLPAVATHTGLALERLVGLRQTSTSMAMVFGPAAAGTLLTLFGGTAVLLVTAATSGAAALLTAAIPHRVGRVAVERDQRVSGWTQFAAGAAVLRRSRLLTGTVTLTVGMAVALGGLQGLVLPLYFSLISRPDLLGFVLTALALGMITCSDPPGRAQNRSPPWCRGVRQRIGARSCVPGPDHRTRSVSVTAWPTNKDPQRQRVCTGARWQKAPSRKAGQSTSAVQYRS